MFATSVPSSSRVALVCPPGVSGAAADATAWLESAKVTASSVEVVDAAALSGLSEMDCLFMRSTSLAHRTALTSTEVLAAALAALKPGGRVVYHDAVPTDEGGVDPLPKVSMAFMLAGLTELTTVDASSGCEVSSVKPAWDVGSSAAVPLRERAPAAATDATAAGAGAGAGAATGGATSAARVWTVLAEDSDAAAAELADEDALLDGDVVPERKAASDCSTRRRACKNCSCGRAEAEAADGAPVMTDEELAKSVSSCGNCYKGDAFRCASCPFLGKPAFKPGSGGAVKLDLAADDF